MPFLTQVKPFATLALDFLYPPRCAACAREIAAPHAFCLECFAAIRMVVEPCCACCGETFPYGLEAEARCGACLSDPPAFDRARAALIYDDASRALLTRFKYGDRTQLQVTLGHLLRRAAAPMLAEADYILPVPLHWRRLLRRKYNQSLLLAAQLAQESKSPLLPRAIRRRRSTAQQTGLSRSARRQNVRGAFVVDQFARPILVGKTLLLVDDVLTTGATVDACARVLKAAGAAKIYVATVARRPATH